MILRELIFATSNPHKVAEVNALLGGTGLQVRSLADIGWDRELPETRDSLYGNALQKACTLADALEADCFSEDTGLLVDALGGRPGVETARFAGPGATPEQNMARLLREMDGVEERTARFLTVIALIVDGATFTFTGSVEGRIAHEPCGTQGFGYDPLFIPLGFDQTFAELGHAVKSGISHRAIATKKLVAFLQSYVRRKSPE